MYQPVNTSPSGTPASLSNNPFIDDPSHPQHRFPDLNAIERTISAPAATTGYGLYPSNGIAGGGAQYSGYSPYMQQQQQQQQQQQYPASMQQPLQTGYTSLQSSSYYGTPQQPQQAQAWSQAQQPGSLNPNMTGMPYQNAYANSAYSQQQQQQPQPYGTYGSAAPPYGMNSSNGYQIQGYAPQHTGYGTTQTQAQLNIFEFDPLSPQLNNNNSGLGTGPAGTPHPRDYVNSHKQELERWDPTSWKQALNTFDALRDAWDIHKRQVEMPMQPGPYCTGLSETSRLQDLHKVAIHNIDTITASSVQMGEVHQSYRHSTDFASRNRVRESLNAALRQLPDWPPPVNSWWYGGRH